MTTKLCRSGAALLSFALAATPALSSDENAVRPAVADAAHEAHHTQAAPTVPKPNGSRAKLPASAHRTGSAGTILTQTSAVRTSCFPGSLNAVLRDISYHFGRPVVVTSGFRGGRGGSYHRKCQAADIQLAGIAPSAVARYARSLGTVGGVGTYGHTRSVHVDVGDRVFSWYGSRRRNAALGTSGCCPTCAAMAQTDGRPRFEAVCTG